VSYFYDLRGPSFSVDTACSSSLVALHLATQSIRAGEISAAIVGGTSANLVPEMFMAFAKLRIYYYTSSIYIYQAMLSTVIAVKTCCPQMEGVKRSMQEEMDIHFAPSLPFLSLAFSLSPSHFPYALISL
jgi:Beta-ketoacyl synthase, N-terminal domain